MQLLCCCLPGGVITKQATDNGRCQTSNWYQMLHSVGLDALARYLY